jgi:hypothetical protein
VFLGDVNLNATMHLERSWEARPVSAFNAS